MRHMITTACCLMLLAAVQGTALADPLKVPDLRRRTTAHRRSRPVRRISSSPSRMAPSAEACRKTPTSRCSATRATRRPPPWWLRGRPPKGKWRTRIEDVPAGTSVVPTAAPSS